MSTEKKTTISIIDDNEMTRELLRLTLRTDGYQVIGESADGETGLEVIKRLKPDVVFLDVILPRTSGLEILKQIRQIHPKAVVLIVTGSNDRATVHTALQNGASGFILKPFNTATVLDAVIAGMQRMRQLSAT